MVEHEIVRGTSKLRVYRVIFAKGLIKNFTSSQINSSDSNGQ